MSLQLSSYSLGVLNETSIYSTWCHTHITVLFSPSSLGYGTTLSINSVQQLKLYMVSEAMIKAGLPNKIYLKQ